ncbi:hypothetical protein HRE53_32835 (plasmid) [Acaryochloris sp. 'Moss Beach']|uniref:hypothetical protein n=1 Tax=Acaryochloris sp. 'Moss Beach' TaxID=2740837 RepID=UPI001F429C39|nr:hypothetical protein [Acaryochloris sp. 'Moss Beach']UJB73419.1 hypothetical protein HRE53_32835 [Acaryochloris sp. 'Moss Beach']
MVQIGEKKLGKLTVKVFQDRPSKEMNDFLDFGVNVSSGMIAVGGGVEGARTPNGALITASYPNTDLTAWLGSTKAHMGEFPNPHRISVFSIGLSVDGMSAEELKSEEHIILRKQISEPGPYPQKQTPVPNGYLLLGGGFHVEYPKGRGNLCTASFPQNSSSWLARAKAHFVESDGIMTTYAICIREKIPGIGTIKNKIMPPTESSTGDHISAVSELGNGFLLTGGGAEVHWTEPGNLLWRLVPYIESTGQGYEVSSKAHAASSPANLSAYSIGIRVST